MERKLITSIINGILRHSFDSELCVREGIALLICRSNDAFISQHFSKEEFDYEKLFADGQNAAYQIEKNIPELQIRLLCEEARQFHVTVLLEVHGDFNTGDRIIKTADLVRCGNFGVIWDIQHSREDPARFWERTKHLIRHVHIKDSTQTKLCPVGEGDRPVAEIVRMLERDGYDGYYSLEWEKRWHPELRDAAEEFPSYVSFMKNILDAQS